MQAVNMLQAKAPLSRLLEAIGQGRACKENRLHARPCPGRHARVRRGATRCFIEGWNRLLAVGTEYALAIEASAAHHQDPLDRIPVAQALVEPMRLMSHDPVVARHSDTIIRV